MLQYFLAVTTAIGIWLATSAPAEAQSPTRALTNVTGDLYRFQNNFHFSAVLETDAGMIVTDPINAEAAEWLKQEIATRFGKPIVYVIYSHDHADHIAGGEVYTDTATVVAHENARATNNRRKATNRRAGIDLFRPHDPFVGWQGSSSHLSGPQPLR